MVERKNMTILEMAKTMLSGSKISDRFWIQVVSTVVHLKNKRLLMVNTRKNPYEIWKCRPSNVKNFRIFGIKCYIRMDDGNIGKFESKSAKGIFL